MSPDSDGLTAAGFLAERRDFMHVYPTPSLSGDGWDVVMRIDGTYHGELLAGLAAAELRQWLDMLTDVPTDGRTWWDGPPTRRRDRPGGRRPTPSRADLAAAGQWARVAGPLLQACQATADGLHPTDPRAAAFLFEMAAALEWLLVGIAIRVPAPRTPA